jgi:hypothetical protein
MFRLPASVRRALSGLSLAVCLLTTGGLAFGASAALAATPAAATDAAPANNSGFIDKSGTDTTAPGSEYALKPKTSETALQPLIGRIASVLVGVSGSIALLIFVWAGITMIRANGDAKLIDQSKKMMVWTVVGLLVIFASEAIIRAVLNVLLKGSVA